MENGLLQFNERKNVLSFKESFHLASTMIGVAFAFQLVFRQWRLRS